MIKLEEISKLFNNKEKYSNFRSDNYSATVIYNYVYVINVFGLNNQEISINIQDNLNSLLIRTTGIRNDIEELEETIKAMLIKEMDVLEQLSTLKKILSGTHSWGNTLGFWWFDGGECLCFRGSDYNRGTDSIVSELTATRDGEIIFNRVKLYFTPDRKLKINLNNKKEISPEKLIEEIELQDDLNRLNDLMSNESIEERRKEREILSAYNNLLTSYEWKIKEYLLMRNL
jgi:hypothetical protein